MRTVRRMSFFRLLNVNTWVIKQNILNSELLSYSDALRDNDLEMLVKEFCALKKLWNLSRVAKIDSIVIIVFVYFCIFVP